MPVGLVRRRVRLDARVAEQLAQGRVEPRPDVDAVRDVADRRLLAQSAPHLARHVSVQRGDAVRRRGEPQRQRRQAEAGLVAEPAELEKLLPVEACVSSERADVPEDELLVEHLVAGRHRRVGGEDRREPDLLERLVGLQPLLDEGADALDLQEGGVAFVQVEHGRLDSERRERADAADAEQQLLADPVLPVAAVERIGQPVDLEQIERDGADFLAPDRGFDRLAGEVDRHRDGLAGDADRLRIDRLVVLGLASFGIDPLPEVAAAVEQADADERHPELRRGLEVVAGEDAEAARVDRQPLVQAELHAEVGDEQLALVASVRALPPGRCVRGRLH